MGPNDSLDADRREQGNFVRVTNERGDLRGGSSMVLKKTFEDGAADVA